MDKLDNANQYDNFAYHTSLLNDFTPALHHRHQINSKGGLATSDAGGGIHQMTGSNSSSIYSTKSLRQQLYQRNPTTRHARRGSFQGSKAFKSITTKKKLHKSLSTGV
jgi:hypothetical protein